MLIEASRGGHTNVANVLLRQPRDTSPLDTPSCSPMGSRNSGLDHASNPTPLAQEGRSSPIATKGVKDDNREDSYAAPVEEKGSEGQVRGKEQAGKDEKEMKGKLCAGTEGGVANEEGGKAVPQSNDVSRLGKSVPKSDDTLDLGDADAASKAKRQKIADGVTLPPSSDLLQSCHHHPECPLSTAAAAPTSAGKTGKGSQKASSPLRYATDSATAMKNIQQWTSGNTSALNQFNASPSKDRSLGTSVDTPLQRPATTSQQPTTSDDLINDIIKGHVTAEDIVRRVSTADEGTARHNRPPVSTRASSGRGQECVVKAAADSQIESAQKVFSSGNFNKNIPLTTSSTKNASSAHGSRDNHTATSSAKTCPATECGSTPLSSAAPSRGPNTTTYAAPTSTTPQATADEQTLANMNLRRLIPHLEVLADLLQNPSSLETQYLAALSERAQMFPGSFPPLGSEDLVTAAAAADSTLGQALPNNLESLAAIAAHFGHLESGPEAPKDLPKDLPNAFEALAAIASQNLAEDKASSMANMDIASLFSNADFAKLLPTLAALEMQGGLGYDQHDPNLKPVPITDPGAMKRLWDDMLMVESNPVYVGDPGLEGDVGGIAMEGLVDDMAEYVEERLQSQQLPGQYGHVESGKGGGEGGRWE